MNAQGEDVVAGIRTPNPISHLEEDMPQVYAQFVEIADKLENHYKDMQDMGLRLKTASSTCCKRRTEKRTAAAALQNCG